MCIQLLNLTIQIRYNGWNVLGENSCLLGEMRTINVFVCVRVLVRHVIKPGLSWLVGPEFGHVAKTHLQ